MTIRFKTLTLLMCILSLLVVTCTPTVFASDGLTLTVSTVNAEPGTDVEVPIVLTGNDMGLAGLMISVGYDENLVLKSITKGSALGTLTYTKPGDLSANPFNIGFDGQDTDNTNGTIATLTFTVPENAEGLYEVGVSYIADNIYDGDLNNVDANIINGGVNVISAVTEPTLSYSNFEKGTSSITLDVNVASPDDIAGNVFVALYNDKNYMVKMKMYPAVETIKASIDSVDGKYIKIMWWDDDYRPITESKKIDIEL